MIQTKTCINVYSDMNTWIDFCIVIGAYEDFTKAEDIVQKAYDDWWDEECCEVCECCFLRGSTKELDGKSYYTCKKGK